MIFRIISLSYQYFVDILQDAGRKTVLIALVVSAAPLYIPRWQHPAKRLGARYAASRMYTCYVYDVLIVQLLLCE